MNQEGIIDKKEMKEIKGEIEKDNLRSGQDKQSNIKYIPKNEKQKHINLDKQEDHKQKQEIIGQ
ncbi:unnamed protein product [Paramecium primaurelia]|uniref:Uncharacterized protein n=1 Tax=Paramecium primaurelia TaxID=5886 RepID=A0A8S1PFF7_PARPR|nr:unnamed protein product [Paramecium primaurelia]